jgi:hypothetical protein
MASKNILLWSTLGLLGLAPKALADAHLYWGAGGSPDKEHYKHMRISLEADQNLGNGLEAGLTFTLIPRHTPGGFINGGGLMKEIDVQTGVNARKRYGNFFITPNVNITTAEEGDPFLSAGLGLGLHLNDHLEIRWDYQRNFSAGIHQDYPEHMMTSSIGFNF